ncbi:MAG TPA: PIG-L deacetylase family protein [Thermodesulfobacteriota bacterium]|nr:PIG-L deacetylase family protein [Thermodesulfobacteriota bacterium]
MNDIEFERAMVVFAHPDDAEVQCAGTVALWAEAGKKVTYVVMTRGDKGTQDRSITPDQLAALRQKEQWDAARELGVEKVVFLPNNDGELEVNLERRKALTRVMREHQPEVLITHDPWMRYQVHPDHRASGMLALDAATSARDFLYFREQIDEGLQPCRLKRALLFASDQPDFWVDIGRTMEKKLKALGRHRSQVAQWPGWEERFRKRAEDFGAAQGMRYAEAFKLLVLR